LERLLGVVVLSTQGLELALELLVLDGELPPLRTRVIDEGLAGQDSALLEALRPRNRFFAGQHVCEARVDVAIHDRLLVVTVLGETLDLRALDRHGAFVLLHAVAVEDANVHNSTVSPGRHAHGGVTDVRSLFTEDGTQKLLFRRHRALALRGDLADENVARLDLGTDVADAGFVEVLQRFFGNVRNVARDFLRPELGVAGHDLVLLDVDRGEDVIGNDALGQEDRVLVVVAVPRHERDEHVAAESEVTEVGRRTVSDDVALVDDVTDADQRTLVDAGRLVRTLELHQAVDVDARLARIEVF